MIMYSCSITICLMWVNFDPQWFEGSLKHRPEQLNGAIGLWHLPHDTITYHCMILAFDFSTLVSVVTPAVQNTYKRCRSRKCIRWHIPVHAIFAVFYVFFLPVLCRPSFTS